MPYFVYVIELDKEVMNSKKFRIKNPDMNLRKICYYVGQSAHKPSIRFKQHKAGYKSNIFVRRFGTSLNPRKYKRFNPIETRQEAEIIERKLADKLRKKGHGVWSN